MQFEYCLLLDRAGKVLVAPRNMSIAGETFDLAGVGKHNHNTHDYLRAVLDH
jgi:hypothetical protein